MDDEKPLSELLAAMFTNYVTYMVIALGFVPGLLLGMLLVARFGNG